MINIPLVVSMQDLDISNGDKVVLSAVDFELAVGEMAYVIGSSGSGKSSLIRTIHGEIPATTGSITVADYDVRNLNAKTLPLLRRKLGIVYQEFHLLQHWTVYRNLEYVLKATEWTSTTDMKTRIQEVLTQIGLAGKQAELVNNLSGGEQQKVAIARAILNNPLLILADEPTGNLDPDSSDEVMYLLHKVAAANKTAILIATHDYRLIEKFPARVYSCKDGQLSEQN